MHRPKLIMNTTTERLNKKPTKKEHWDDSPIIMISETK